ncbi:MmcQ/YjbR family DNA-binding protein [Lunatimonas salinarum]|uniref:MmcQ/YjbR family DNA-binding protein n=1 Tax=Lunatimonas salinarum TaxID=1774590 RepID=UPI001ADF7203|nr:MmcQ/YjbR family DNA-binding protein [Lunatimonas salinarum]
MDIHRFRDYCLAKRGTTEDTPFDADTLCFRVGGKIFAIIDIELFQSVNLKCLPERAEEIRVAYPTVSPGYHMNKRHWNTVPFDGSVKDSDILSWVDHSYQLVFNSLPKSIQVSLAK